MALYVARWDCPACGTRGIEGPETVCPNCGSSRPKNVRFYLPNDATSVTSDSVRAEARAGANWQCGHCSAHNPATVKVCRACGNPRDEQSADVALEVREFSEGEVPRTGAKARPSSPESNSRPKGRSRIRNILLAIGFIALIFFGGSWPVSVDVEVSGFRWERSVQMQHLEAVRKEAWRLPGGARDVERFRAVRRYDQVLRGYEKRYRDVKVQVGTEQYVCGKRDLGNGYFEDKYCTRPVYETRREAYDEPIYDRVPIYDTKYRFTVDEWVDKAGQLLRAGGTDQNARWPDRSYDDPRRWRPGAQREAYYVTVTLPNDDQHEEQLSRQAWERLDRGATVAGKKGLLWGGWYGLK